MADEVLKTQKCPQEYVLNSYLIGTLYGDERERAERHIANCPYCIYRIAEANDVLREGVMERVKGIIMNIKKYVNVWFLLCVTLFFLSFIFPHYFIQFLTGSILFGIKWIVDNKNTKMLIMIYEAWKQGGQEEANRIIESLDSKMRRR